MFNLFKKKKPAEDFFWEWFVKNEKRIWDFEVDRDAIFEQLRSELIKVQDGLCFEFGPIVDDRRELVISADGIASLFPEVSKLIIAAPKLAHWEFTAFRPRFNGFEEFEITFNDIALKPSDILFQATTSSGAFDIDLFHPSMTEENRGAFSGAIFLMLDMAIGEYDVATGVRHLEFLDANTNPITKDFFPLVELPKVFDAYQGHQPTT